MVTVSGSKYWWGSEAPDRQQGATAVICGASLRRRARMSDPKEPLIFKQTPDHRGYSDASSPPPYSYQEQQPPAYSAAPIGSSLRKSEAAGTRYESFQDINPETASDTASLISTLSFEDETVRRAFVRK
ncbi:hypothetical protein AMECASPLE_030939, partial [Ameca splendens]